MNDKKFGCRKLLQLKYRKGGNSALGILYFDLFGAKIWAHVGSKMAKKFIFMPAISLLIQFFLKEKFLRALVF